jgi:hypothetical protein
MLAIALLAAWRMLSDIRRKTDQKRGRPARWSVKNLLKGARAAGDCTLGEAAQTPQRVKRDHEPAPPNEPARPKSYGDEGSGAGHTTLHAQPLGGHPGAA